MKERIRGNAWKINWNEWSKEVFERAKNENKLILLSLSGVWCHWCHVMDETTYSDEEIIKIINENFIPIRVDVDERPDISERYNFGGFPTFAFLTPEAEVITGGTYVPPEQFKEILKEMIEIQKKVNIKELASQTVSRKTELRKANPNEKIIWDVVDILISYFDENYGGFGLEPKFPIGDAILFLENMYAITKKAGFNVMVKKTLEGIISGLYDDVEGGFFRYSVSRDWKTPHYEKMLETNSNLLHCISYWYYLTGDKYYEEIARKTANYLLNILRDKDTGLFYSSQDADEQYYALNLEDRKKRNPPYIDKNIYSCKNANCALAFFRAGLYLGDENYIEISKNVWEKLVNDYFKNEGVLHSKDKNYTFLDDNAYLLDLSIQLYYYSLDEKYLDIANKLGNIIVNNFLDDNGLLKDSKQYEDSIGLLKEPFHPISENAIVMKDLYILSMLKGNEKFGEVSKNICSILSANYVNYAIFASSFANNLLLMLNQIEIRLVYSDISEPRKILHDNKLLLNPLISIKYIDAKAEDARKEYSKEGIYVCKGQVCYPPINDMDEFSKLMNKLVKETLKI